MTNESYTTFRLEQDKAVATLTLDRPDVRNAFDETMIAELSCAFDEVACDETIRVLILTGAGAVFCAGADLNWMKRVAGYSYEENLEDARVFAKMIEKLYRIPKPTIASVNGACMGGGVGLVCACDVTVASTDAVFALREVLLGIAPATIAPYVLRKMGERWARDYFLTGRTFDAQRAKEIGMVDDVVAPGDLDAQSRRWAQRFLHAGPDAARVTKALISRVAWSSIEDVQEEMADVIARLRCSAEGREGFQAFFEKRRPSWDSGE